MLPFLVSPKIAGQTFSAELAGHQVRPVRETLFELLVPQSFFDMSSCRELLLVPPGHLWLQFPVWVHAYVSDMLLGWATNDKSAGFDLGMAFDEINL